MRIGAETNAKRAVLFADVSDSTAMYEAIGDARALALINRLFGLLRKRVAAAGGAVVKTLGDGMVCQFGEPDAAFRAACEMQAATQRMRVPDTERRLAIKVGFNYGPVLLKGDDLFGDTVNLCSRLVALANPKQVLTTQQTVEALAPGYRKRCRELYEKKMRGRREEVTVCELLWRSDPDVTALNLKRELRRGQQGILKLSYGGDSFTVEPGDAVRVGRDKSNDIVVASQHASRLHARIFGRDGNFVIVDQSSNGTFVLINGTERELRLQREEAVMGERGAIGLGSSTEEGGDHVLRYRVERRAQPRT
jgi:adenylate cyclase